jgi:hypothetical protein
MERQPSEAQGKQCCAPTITDRDRFREWAEELYDGDDKSEGRRITLA